MILPKIKEVTNILSFCKDIFSKGSFRQVQNYISGLISVGKKSVKKISEASRTNQQSLNYLLNEAKFEIKDQYLDAARARTILGWKGRVGLNKGLLQTMNWYKDHGQS